MKKLVIKTALITLMSVILVFGITFGSLCLFAPKTVARVFDGVGNYSAAVFFYQKDYEKTGNIDDLVFIIDKTYSKGDDALAKDLLKEMVEHQDFSEYCARLDKAGEMPTREYYYVYYVTTLISLGEEQSAMDVSKAFALEFGYTEYNPYRTLVDLYKNKTDEEKKVLKDSLTETRSEISVLEQALLDLDYLKLL